MTIPESLRECCRPVPAADLDVQPGGYTLPAALREFYGDTDGLEIPALGTEILALGAAVKYGEDLDFHPLSQLLGLLPISESNDSNPYCVILGERLNGAVVRLSHDDDTSVTHRSLASFLGSLGELATGGGELIDDLAAEAIDDERLRADADGVVAELLAADDFDETVIVPLVTVCSPATLVRMVESDDMWVREAAARQLGKTSYFEARPALERLAKVGSRQDNREAKASLSKLNREYYSQRRA